MLRPGGRVGLVHTTSWYFQHDPRWRWHEETLCAAGAFPPGDAAAARRDDHVDLAVRLRPAGFTAVRGAEAAVDLVFQDEEE